MPYGSGTVWTGQAGGEVTANNVGFRAVFGLSRSEEVFDITKGQEAKTVARNLKNAWNGTYFLEAQLLKDKNGQRVIVAFKRGLVVPPDSMWVDGPKTNGWQQVNKDPLEVVSGLFVHEKELEDRNKP